MSRRTTAGLPEHTGTETEVITQFPVPNTYSEGGALLNDGRQLRQADVDGQVPRLPAEGAHQRELPLEPRPPNTPVQQHSPPRWKLIRFHSRMHQFSTGWRPRPRQGCGLCRSLSKIEAMCIFADGRCTPQRTSTRHRVQQEVGAKKKNI